MKLYEEVDKRFLTMAPHEGGSISWDVSAHQSRKDGSTNIDAGIDITDCSRKIGLEFYCSTPARFKQRVAKLENLISSLQEFHYALHEARSKKVEAILKYRKEKKGERFKSKEAEKDNGE
mgnify:CR=1 FL=1|jgi:hypothetical protein|tara:strand:+ start:30 stop:389 length:360 start_codon:yes stop_codon:yes gene_type:complete